MATEFSISIDLAELMEIGPIARAGMFTNLASQVEAVAQVGVERWKRAALKAPLWEGERQAYAASIRYSMTGSYSAEIVSDYKYVEDIETGRPAYDLKRMLSTSMKVRMSKKGRRYLIIPFRHNTPGNDAHAPAMPEHVYAAAKELSASRIIGGHRRQSGTGAFDVKTRQPYMVAGRNYRWGDRLPPGMTPKKAAHHKTDPHAGMVRMDAKTPGGKRYSTYLTFRVMVEGSPGWIIKPRPGLFIAKAVADSIQRTAATDFAAAMQRDLA
jgi:hypothetical protein